MISLLVLLPAVLLFLAALGIIILQQVRPSIGYAWAIGAAMGLLTVIAAIFLRWRLPLQLSIEQFRSFGDLSSPPTFRLDLYSWPYMFSLAVLALAFLLTDAARLEREARPLNWAAGLALSGLGLLTVMAGNPITIIMTWTAVDLVEFLMVMMTRAGRSMGAQTITAFSVRVAGTLLVVLAILFARSNAISFDLIPIPPDLSIFLLLAAGLRLGVLPLNLPYSREVYVWRGLGTIMRMISPASSLVVLGRMPEQAIAPEWKGLLLALTVLASIYGSSMWFAARDEINGRPYWFLALGALAVASVIYGHPQSSIAWGAALILPGSILFFYSARRQQILFIPLLALLGLVGLPYTPAASGWLGIVGERFNLYTLLFILSVLFLFWGYLRHVLRPRDELYRMERWVHTVYPAGLLFLVLAQWLIGIFGWPGSLTLGIWWLSAAVVVVASIGAILAFFLWSRVKQGMAGEESGSIPGSWVVAFAQQAGGVLNDIFRLNWLYQFISWLYRVVQNFIELLTAMLEGDGGILWSLVLLVLLISMVRAGGGP